MKRRNRKSKRMTLDDPKAMGGSSCGAPSPARGRLTCATEFMNDSKPTAPGTPDETDGSARQRILIILAWLPVLLKMLACGWGWKEIGGICGKIGLTDTAFREHPHSGDYLLVENYWYGRLKHLDRQ